MRKGQIANLGPLVRVKGNEGEKCDRVDIHLRADALNRRYQHGYERIDALELLGATFVDKKRDMLGSYKLWKRAMEDRYALIV